MKKRCILFLGAAVVFAALAGCGLAEEKITLFPSNVSTAQVIHTQCSSQVSHKLSEEEITAVEGWVEGLKLRPQRFAEGEGPNQEWEGGEIYEFHLNNGESSFSYTIIGDSYILANGQWYLVENPSAPPVAMEEAEEDEEALLWDRIPMVMVNGRLYYDTGEQSLLQRRCGTMDGEITSAVDASQVPTEDNQSNFGAGFGYQYGAEGTIEVHINDQWIVFKSRDGTGN